MSFQLPDSIIDALLDKLGNDDAFRATFANDARAALASLGFEPAADGSIVRGIWMCLDVQELASKEVIRAAAGDVRIRLRAKEAVYFPFVLDVKSTDKAA